MDVFNFVQGDSFVLDTDLLDKFMSTVKEVEFSPRQFSTPCS